MAISVDLGPSSGADARVYLDEPGNRLLILSRRGGCLPVLGVGLVAAVATCQAPVAAGRFEWWQLAIGVVLGIPGGWLLFGRSWIRLDRRRSLVERGISILTAHPYERRRLGCFERVVIAQDDSVSTDSDGHSTTTTTFPVTLQGDGVASLRLATAGIWENAIPVSEAVARFLHLPLNDRAIGKTRAPQELDLALREQARSHADDLPKRSPQVPGLRSRVLEHTDELLRADIPRPDPRAWLTLLAIVGLFWCIPVGLLSREPLPTFGPLVIVAATAVKCVLGFRSRIRVTPELLEVTTYGLVVRRTVSFLGSELEDLVVRRFESGGPRTSLAHMMDGVLIARSDRAAVRFGHGLTFAELRWLRHEIHRIIAAPSDSEPAAAGEGEAPPRVIHWLPAYAGWTVGALLAGIAGGFLDLGVALPFLEHLLNVGAMLGLVAGLVLISVRREEARENSARLVQLALLGALLLYLTGWVQLQPSFDEGALLRSASKDYRFWLGWIPMAALIDVLLAEAFQWLLRIRRVLRGDAVAD